jgi:hypothetical protein
MKQKVTDGVVNFENARPWVEALFKEDPQKLIERAFAVEPAVMSAVAVAGKRTADLLERHGASEQTQSFVLSQTCVAGAIAIELMRKGNSVLFADLLQEPTEPKGENHE